MPCGAAGVRTPDCGRLAPFIPRLVARFGKKNLYQYCGMFTVAGGVALFLTPAGMPLPALLFVAVKGFGVQLINTLMFALEKASLGLVPAAAAVLAMLVFIRYPLTEQRYQTMISETDARKKALLDAPAVAPVPIPATV